MSPVARAFIGAITTVVFLGIAATLYAEQRWTLALVLGGLGLLRGVVLVRQVVALSARRDPEE